MITRQNVPKPVVVVRIVRQQHPQPIADGDAGSCNQKRVGESRVLRVGQLVECLPGDEHRHDDGLAAAGGHLKRHAKQQRVGPFVGSAEIVLNPGVTILLGRLGDVDRRFKCFDLAEEQLPFAGRVRPILDQLGGRLGNTGVVSLSPHRDPGANLIDELVLFDAVLGPFGIENELSLLALFLLGLGNRHKVGTDTALVDDLVGNALVRKLKMPRRLGEWRV